MRDESHKARSTERQNKGGGRFEEGERTGEDSKELAFYQSTQTRVPDLDSGT